MSIRVNETESCLTVQSRLPFTATFLWIGTAVNAAAAIVELYSGTDPYRMLGWLVVVVVLAGAAWVFGESSKFCFARAENRFTWSHSRVFLKRHSHTSLGDVKNARRQRYYDDGVAHYRLVVETTHEPVSFTDSYGGDADELSRVVDRINTFLETEKHS